MTDPEKKIISMMQLRAKMWAKKIRQKEVAQSIGVTQGMISHVLNGRKNSARVIKAIKEVIYERRRNNHNL